MATKVAAKPRKINIERPIRRRSGQAPRSVHHDRITTLSRFDVVGWMQHLQWPAMAATLLSAWLVAAQYKKWRRSGFWVFLLSNVLWAGWGWHDHAYALILLQIGLAALNIRGVTAND
jgi:hypothetical protein